MGFLRLYPLVEKDRAVRAVVPITWSYRCPVHGVTEDATGNAVADTGAPNAMFPEVALPPGHVTWDDLAPGGSIPTLQGSREYRWWPIELQALGIPIGSRIKVWRGDYPNFPVVGVNDFFRQFRVRFDLGSRPPSWEVEPLVAGIMLAPPDDGRDVLEALESYPHVTYTTATDRSEFSSKRLTAPNAVSGPAPGGDGLVFLDTGRHSHHGG